MSTRPCSVSMHLYECFSVCVLCAWTIASQSRLNISACTCIFCFHQSFGLISFSTPVDEVTGRCGVFLLLPTSGPFPAGFPQTIKSSRLPAVSVITPPIRMTSEDEYQWVRRVRTTKLSQQHGLWFICTWTKPRHEQGANSERWNHSWSMEYNSYSIQMQLHTVQL